MLKTTDNNHYDIIQTGGILQDIQEKHLNPIVMFSYFLVIALLVIAGLWMYFGKTDIVITARGKVVPEGGVLVIQSIDKGILTRIDVSEGQIVKKGDVLGIINPGLEEPELENRNLIDQENMALEELAGAKDRLKTANERLQRLTRVSDIIRAADFESAKQDSLLNLHEVKRLQFLIDEIKNKRKQQEMQRQVLTAPVDGTVDKIYFKKQGAVVTPAQNILTIIPEDVPLQIKALVKNQDIGFVKKGQHVSIKLDSFNFQKYGMIDGTVKHIALDSTYNENLGNVFEILITPQNYSLSVDGHTEYLKNGMTTSNEIIIGNRRILEFFIYPILNLNQTFGNR